jgi:hypothetical protein
LAIGVLGQFQRALRQRMSMHLVAGAADRCAFHFKLFIERIQHPHCLFDDFRADAVARQDCDFHLFFSE